MIEDIINIDRSFFLFLNNLGTEIYDPFWIFISDQTYMFLLISPFLFFYFYKEHQNKMFLGLFFLICCLGLTDFLHVHLFKNVFMRLRPCWDPDVAPFTRILVDKGGLYGFVSGHAAKSMTVVTFTLLYLKRYDLYFKYGLIFWVMLVSYSRIYLGKHFPLDILFGILLGFSIAYFVFKIHRKIIKI